MSIAPPVADASPWFVIPLSVQREGEVYCVGNRELDAFYHFPEEGVRIIALLREGLSADGIRARLQADGFDEVDVDDFIGTLHEIGFVLPAAERDRFAATLAEADAGDRRLRFSLPTGVARALFSWPTFALYLALLGAAAASAIADPRLRLDFGAFFLEDHLTLTLVALLGLYAVSASLHEFGHMAAAARYGIRSRLGVGHRLWQIVAEADLTGILSLPRRQRYLPLLAGMMTDLLSIALITLALRWLLAGGGDGFLTHLLRAWILQIAISITWQFNIFLKTDVYYVLCNHFGHPDLDDEARRYLRDRLHRASFGMLGRHDGALDPRHLGVLRTFTAIWLLGRITALAFLLLVLIPTLLRYAERAFDAFRGPADGRAEAWDATAFAAISIALFAVGMAMWLRRRKRVTPLQTGEPT